MSTSKHIDKLCIAAVCLTLVLTLLFMFAGPLGLEAAAKSMTYEKTLFDTSYVHQIDIVMNDWDGFIENCESEEYSACTVVIDGKKHSNIAIRAKGNTSLSSVRSMGSQRYSFKLEFDHYEEGKTCDGLDKLCLNNLIQDNTMMKDYLVYQMMDSFGVDAPLCSFAYITVNGEDWGLYLAVEGVEDSFLARNYGSDAGELYKPDSMNFGGGRGNGKGFKMEDLEMDFDFDGKTQPEQSVDGVTQATGNGEKQSENSTKQSFGKNGESSDRLGGFSNQPGQSGQQGELPQMPDMNGTQGNMPQMPQMPEQSVDGVTQATESTPEQSGNSPQNGFSQRPDANGGFPQMPEQSGQQGEMPQIPGGMGGFGGFGGMGSSDVKLQYIDDDPSSYSNIFDSAKTDITEADKERLIGSLKALSSYSDLDEVLDMDEVLRYFVVHNFVVNGDSYTGSMVHNYYLHEKNGALSMIPWDYNLAFGTFQGGNASSSVNASIDSPVSGGSADDRPMVGWIFSDEAYTQEYHRLFEEFLETWYSDGRMASMIEETAAMLQPYVEKDPSKFCSTEEFEAGVQTLEQFVSLRAEAVFRQMAGDDTPVDTNGLNLSAMGTMNSGGRGGDTSFAGRPSQESTGSLPQNGSVQVPSFGGKDRTEGMQAFPEFSGSKDSLGASQGETWSFQKPETDPGNMPSGTSGKDAWFLIALSSAVLAAGLWIAGSKKY